MKTIFLIIIFSNILMSIDCEEVQAFMKPCPSCSSPPFESVNVSCYCVLGTPMLRKYKCGPVCETLGLCCEGKVVNPNFESQF
jgi:hypothetical protein